MMPDHTGSGIPHDLTDLLPHLRLIAMDRTVAAGSLVFLKGAVFKPEPRVFQQLPTFIAEFPFCMVIVPAVNSDHGFYGFSLSFHAGV